MALTARPESYRDWNIVFVTPGRPGCCRAMAAFECAWICWSIFQISVDKSMRHAGILYQTCLPRYLRHLAAFGKAWICNVWHMAPYRLQNTGKFALSMQLCLQGSRSFRGVQDPSTTVLRLRVGLLTCPPGALKTIWLLSVSRLKLKLAWDRSFGSDGRRRSHLGTSW